MNFGEVLKLRKINIMKQRSAHNQAIQRHVDNDGLIIPLSQAPGGLQEVIKRVFGKAVEVIDDDVPPSGKAH